MPYHAPSKILRLIGAIMPTVNIPAKVRFALYILGALASLGVSYAVDKKWAGDAEVRLVQGLVALIALLAAAKTNLAETPEEPAEGDPGMAEG
jgi:hypothetical protein